ncbi:MAG: metal ABC transporter permease [Bacteroidetes bacterium]|jgi:ABC-type Mn2+/Zn2+ transport system permease subunit|nr:metal ABC transporter permease [Bacteroidota bacterium]
MNPDWNLLTEGYEQRALLASLLVGISCGLLGCLIVLQNMSLIGDALSHSILPGVVAGYVVVGHSLFALFAGSVVAGMVSAILITLLQRHAAARNDASIGIVFSFMFALGIIGISWLTQQQGVHIDMKDFLFGNVLGVSRQDLWLTGLIAVYVALSLLVFYRYFFAVTFSRVVARTQGIRTGWVHYYMMLLLSFSVVAALQSVGVILVVAMLVIPASTALLLSRRLPHMLAWSALFGALSACIGLIGAIRLNWPPGPTMTVCAGLLYLAVLLLAPRRRRIWSRLGHRRRRTSDKSDKAIHDTHP